MKSILNSNSFRLIISLIIIFILIIAPQTCLSGARRGLMLWFNTLLPTLFPFFIITRLIIELDLCPHIFRPYYPIFVGLLAGYPAGALTCSEMSRRNILTITNAQCLLIACNNASPAFLINYVNCYCLGLTNHKFVIWLSVICSSAATALIYHMFLNIQNKDQSNVSNNKHENAGNNTNNTVHTSKTNCPISSIIESIMMNSFEILVMIGGYVIIFSILAALIMNLPVSGLYTAILSGILEVTTGCSLIEELQGTVPLYIKSAAAAALCGFGGLSAILQTNSAIGSSNLSIKKYISHKLICGILSGLICFAILHITHLH